MTPMIIGSMASQIFDWLCLSETIVSVFPAVEKYLNLTTIRCNALLQPHLERVQAFHDHNLLTLLSDILLLVTFTNAEMDWGTDDNPRVSASNSDPIANRVNAAIRARIRNVAGSADELADDVVRKVVEGCELRIQGMRKAMGSEEIEQMAPGKQKTCARSKLDQKITRKKPEVLANSFSQAVKLFSYEIRALHVENQSPPPNHELLSVANTNLQVENQSLTRDKELLGAVITNLQVENQSLTHDKEQLAAANRNLQVKSQSLTHEKELLAEANKNLNVECQRLTYGDQFLVSENRDQRTEIQTLRQNILILAAKVEELRRLLHDLLSTKPTAGSEPRSGPDDHPSGGAPPKYDGQDDEYPDSGRPGPSSNGGPSFFANSSSNGYFLSESLPNAQPPTDTSEDVSSSSPDENSSSEESNSDEESIISLDSSSITTKPLSVENSSNDVNTEEKVDELLSTEDRMPDPRSMNEEGSQESVCNGTSPLKLESGAEHNTRMSSPLIELNTQEPGGISIPHQCWTPKGTLALSKSLTWLRRTPIEVPDNDMPVLKLPSPSGLSVTMVFSLRSGSMVSVSVGPSALTRVTERRCSRRTRNLRNERPPCMPNTLGCAERACEGRAQEPSSGTDSTFQP